MEITMTDENTVDPIEPTEPTQPKEEQEVTDSFNVRDYTNGAINLRGSIPTQGVGLSEKGKDIEPIILPNGAVAKILEDPYWDAIAQIHTNYGLAFMDETEEMRIIRAKVKVRFEREFTKTFTTEEYLLMDKILSATNLLYSTKNLHTTKDPFDVPDSQWEQGYVNTRNEFTPIGGSASPNFDFKNGPLTGDKAAAMLATRFGFGTNGNFNLPNSLISLVFSNPSNNELFNLDETLDFEKVDLGMNSLGYFFSANGQKFYSTVVDFILRKVIRTNPEIASKELLKSLIKVTDIQALAIGLANVMYPDGYPFSTYDEVTKTETQHGLVKPLRMCIVNNAVIPEGCKRIREKKNISIEDVIEYQHELESSFKNNFLVLNDAGIPIIFKFKIPNLAEFEQYSAQWINHVESVISSDRSTLSASKREAIYNAHAGALLASQYLAYVDYIYIRSEEEKELDEYKQGRYADLVALGNSNQKISKPEDILLQLNLISGDNIITEQFVEAVALFRDSSHTYMVGTAEVLTPSQKEKMTKEQIEYQLKHPKMIPIDAVSLFFQLRGRRLEGVSAVPTKRAKS